MISRKVRADKTIINEFVHYFRTLVTIEHKYVIKLEYNMWILYLLAAAGLKENYFLKKNPKLTHSEMCRE